MGTVNWAGPSVIDTKVVSAILKADRDNIMLKQRCDMFRLLVDPVLKVYRKTGFISLVMDELRFILMSYRNMLFDTRMVASDSKTEIVLFNCTRRRSRFRSFYPKGVLTFFCTDDGTGEEVEAACLTADEIYDIILDMSVSTLYMGSKYG